MANDYRSNTQKKLVKIDISSDSVCPWCFVGKKNLDNAIASSNDKYDFQVLLSQFVCVLCSSFNEYALLIKGFEFNFCR